MWTVVPSERSRRTWASSAPPVTKVTVWAVPPADASWTAASKPGALFARLVFSSAAPVKESWSSSSFNSAACGSSYVSVWPSCRVIRTVSYLSKPPT